MRGALAMSLLREPKTRYAPLVSAIDLMLGRSLDGYVLSDRIGTGATGVVYRATREGDTKTYAVKVLSAAVRDPESMRRRFEREARALSRLSHEHIVDIVSFGATDEAVFIAMELLSGETLEERLRRAPLAPSDSMALMRQILEALAFAHDRQIVHRDLKPANVFLIAREGGDESDTLPRAKILDFGLAKFLSIDEESEDGTLTRRGRVVGTPAYMAPEQITGELLDVRADVYAAGVLFFELLADRRPFDYDRRSDLLRGHLFEPVPKLADARPGLEVDPNLEAVVQRALAKLPAERFPDARAFLDALAPFGSASVSLASRRRRQALTSKPAPSVPASSQQSSRPSSSQAATSEQVSSQQATSRPSLSQPVSSQPVSSQPVSSQPGSSQPGSSQPARSLEADSERALARASTAGTAACARASAPPTPPFADTEAVVDAGVNTRARRWMSVAAWVIAFASFGALLALAIYATTLR